MADKTISDLTAAASVDLTTLIEVENAGPISRKATLLQVQSALTGIVQPPFVDTTAIVKGSVDGTKQLRFEVDGFTAGTTRVATPPNQDFTIAGINVAQIFSQTQTFTPATNNRSINVTGVSQTGASSLNFIGIIGTWNTTGTPSAFLIQITDSASNAASKLIACEVGGNPVFSVGKTGVLNLVDDLTQVFNPGVNNAGINVGAVAADPASPVNGDLWYQSTANALRARINGATVDLGSGGSTLPVVDTTAIVKGSVDATKLLRFEVDGFSAGVTRVATPPNQDFTIAGINVAQTFSQKQTFTPTVNTEAIVVSGYSITGAQQQSLLNLSGTWNTTGAPSGILLNITNTASLADSSFLLDLKVNAATKVSIDTDGDFATAGGISAGNGQFSVASDGSFIAGGGGPFAVDASSNLTINNQITFNSSGFTMFDDGAKFVFSTDLQISTILTFAASGFTITDNAGRLEFSSGIQIGTATLDDDSGALLSNTIKATTALEVSGCQLTVSAGDTLIIQSGFVLQLGSAASAGLLIATHSIEVKDSTGTSYSLLCRSI